MDFRKFAKDYIARAFEKSPGTAQSDPEVTQMQELLRQDELDHAAELPQGEPEHEAPSLPGAPDVPQEAATGAPEIVAPESGGDEVAANNSPPALVYETQADKTPPKEQDLPEIFRSNEQSRNLDPVETAERLRSEGVETKDVMLPEGIRDTELVPQDLPFDFHELMSVARHQVDLPALVLAEDPVLLPPLPSVIVPESTSDQAHRLLLQQGDLIRQFERRVP